MDNFEYLNQISQSNRPVRSPHAKSNAPHKSFLIKLIVGGIVLFFLLMALGGLLSSLGNKTTELMKQIYLRSNNLNTILTTYNKSLKTPKLRAIGVSLSSILTNASNQLGGYITAHDDSKNALTPSENTAAEESTLLAELNMSLTNAKLNGILDRVYDNQIGLQVSLLISQVSELLARTKDPNLVNILTPLLSSLQTIHQDIEAYSSN